MGLLADNAWVNGETTQKNALTFLSEGHVIPTGEQLADSPYPSPE